VTDLATKIRQRAEDWVENILDPQAAAKAVLAVLERHKPTDGGMGFRDGGYGSIEPACTTCGTYDEYAEDWPCSTITAMATALGIPTGDDHE
jgi:hypothetical protein